MAEGSSKLDLRQLVAELRDVVDWFKLGISLGIDHSHLKKIEADYRGDVERCKTEMVSFWRDNDENASVEKLTRALEEIDHRNIARQLRDKYNVLQIGYGSKHSMLRITESDELLTPPSEGGKRQEYNKCMINKLDQEVKVEYAKFTLELLKLFTDKGVSVDDAIYTFVNLDDESSLTRDMREAKDVQGFLTALKRTQSWYDFGKMASMVAILGGDKGDRLVSSYKAKLKVLLQERSKVYGGKTEKIVMKVDESKESFTEEKIIAFRNTIVKVLGIEHQQLVLKGVKKGCVELTYLFPQALAPKLKSRVMACTDELKKLHVESVCIGSETMGSENQLSGRTEKEEVPSKPENVHSHISSEQQIMQAKDDCIPLSIRRHLDSFESASQYLPQPRTAMLSESDLDGVLSDDKVQTCHSWKEFGLQLGLTISDLKKIEQDNHYEIDACKREMLLVWLRNGDNPTLKELHTAVDKVSDHEREAKEQKIKVDR